MVVFLCFLHWEITLQVSTTITITDPMPCRTVTLQVQLHVPFVCVGVLFLTATKKLLFLGVSSWWELTARALFFQVGEFKWYRNQVIQAKAVTFIDPLSLEVRNNHNLWVWVTFNHPKEVTSIARKVRNEFPLVQLETLKFKEFKVSFLVGIKLGMAFKIIDSRPAWLESYVMVVPAICDPKMAFIR